MNESGASKPRPLEVATGRGDAIAALYDLYATRLYRVAMMMTRRHAEAEDLVHEVFVSVIRSKTPLADVANRSAYLFTALRRAAGRRAKQRREVALGLEAAAVVAPITTGSRLDSCESLEWALRQLPNEQREVIVLKIDGELTFAQIGEVLEINSNTAASRYRYALEKLHDLLSDEWA